MIKLKSLESYTQVHKFPRRFNDLSNAQVKAFELCSKDFEVIWIKAHEWSAGWANY